MIKKEFFAYLGMGIIILMLIFLILQRLGIIHSISAADAVIGVSIGQLFYNGYMFRAIREIDKKLDDHENRLRELEKRL